MFNRFLESLYQIRKALSVRLGQERSEKSEKKKINKELEKGTI